MIAVTYKNDDAKEFTDFESVTDAEKVVGIEISNEDNLTSLKGIERFSSLTSLAIEDCPALTSLAGVENLNQLCSVSFDGTSITTIDELRKYTNMEELHCTNSKLTSIPEWIVNFKKLQYMSFEGNCIETVPFKLFNWMCYKAEGNLTSFIDFVTEVNK